MSARIAPVMASLGGLFLALVVSGVMGSEHLSHEVLLGLYVLAFLPYFVTLYLLRPCQASSQQVWWVVLGTALVLRLILVMCEPVWSDDVYRYVWDGRVAAAGINPFMYAPDASELESLRDEVIWPGINHKHISTIYPPVAQWVFLINAWLGGGARLLRALFVGVEGVMLWGAWRLLKDSGWWRERGLWACVAYVLNPVVCVELAWSGHLDVLAYGPLTLAVLWWTVPAHRSWRHVLWSGAMLGVSVAAKMLPIVLAPLWLFAPRRGQGLATLIKRRVVLMMLVGGIVVGSYVPYVDAGTQLFAGFGAYATTWRGNDGAFRAVMTLSEESFRAWTPAKMRADPRQPDSKAFVTLKGVEDVFIERGLTRKWEGKTIADNTFAEDQVSQTVAKLIVAALMGLAMLWALLVTRDVRLSVLMLLVLLFFMAPTVYPWYVAWLVPLGVVQRRTMWAPLVFSATSLTAYMAILSFIERGVWTVPWWGVGFGALCVATAMMRDVFKARELSKEG